MNLLRNQKFCRECGEHLDIITRRVSYDASTGVPLYAVNGHCFKKQRRWDRHSSGDVETAGGGPLLMSAIEAASYFE